MFLFINYYIIYNRAPHHIIYTYVIHIISVGFSQLVVLDHFPRQISTSLSGRSRGTTDCKKRSLCCRQVAFKTCPPPRHISTGHWPQEGQKMYAHQQPLGSHYTERSIMKQAGACETRLIFLGTSL